MEVFGCRVGEDALIHADNHGFLVIPEEDQKGLYEAACFMDANECSTLIAAARESSGDDLEGTLNRLDKAAARFTENVKTKFKRRGEW